MPNPLFDDLLGNKLDSNSPFLRSRDNDIISYAQFHEKVARSANALVELGAAPGHRVTVQVEKSVDALTLYFATLAVGAVYCPLNSDYTVGELDHFIKDAKPSLVICDPSSENAVQSIAAEIDARVTTLDCNGSGSLPSMANEMPEHFDPADRASDDLAAILYTSGTTGLSKGAMLSHSNLLSNAHVLRKFWRFTEQDVLLHILPIFHAHGLFVAINTTALSGGSLIFHPRFEIDSVLRDLPHATTMMGVPTHYTRLLADDRFGGALVRNMRLFVSGSAPLRASTHSEFEKRTGHRILERYGMTETTMIASNPYDGERKAGTVGLPLPGISTRISKSSTGTGGYQRDVGILEVAGPNVFSGYWGKPEKTAAEFSNDGYFVTGDLATLDSDGYISIVGRDKDLIISGGYNVYPKEIELLIDQVPGVLESAVIGVPHMDFGEAVVALVVLEEQIAPSTGDILEWIAPALAKFKLPKHMEILNSLPRNSMGKVQKATLRLEFQNLLV